MYQLVLKAVDSRNATDEELEAAGIDESQIPKDEDGKAWAIAAHQAATVKALRYGNAPIIINQAMTGDGKTMAGRFQLLSQQWRTFAMYPTNELAHDQVQSFDELMNHWIPPVWGKRPDRRLINAQEIDEFSFGDGDPKRMSAIKGMLWDAYVLSNPDIFHLIMSFAYQQAGVAGDFLPTYVAERFQLYIFDEFHLFGIEQTAAVMIAMLLLKRLRGITNPPRFLFLSATPQETLSALAGLVGLEVEPIKGHYEHGQDKPSIGYRRILQKSDLYLYSGRLEDWIREHFEDVIQAFFLNQKPAAKGLIIANSVATAHRIFAYLEEPCKQATIKLGINTGLTPKEDRSREFDLLVATSTVDVGVDFKINFLIFESRDAASHQQRLGRLGRHKSTDGYDFEIFEAHALIPQWTLEGLMQAFPENSLVDRETYKAKLAENFSPLQQFDGYIRHWAGVQAAKILHELSDSVIRKQYKELSKNLTADYKSIFGASSIHKYGKLGEEKRGATIQAAISFRGGSPFTALIQDPETNSQKIMSYSLSSLLLNADLQAISIEDMLETAKKRNQDPHALEKTKPLAAYRLLGWREKPRELSFELDAELPEEALCTVIEQNRFRFICPEMSELQALNKQLYERVFVAFFIPDKDPDMVRRLLRLGYQLELFRFRARNNLTGTVVFGRDALLMDSVFIKRKSENALFW